MGKTTNKFAPELLASLGARTRYLLADKGYDADALRRSLRQAGAVPVIPGRRSRKRAVSYDKQRYRDRHLIENAFCRLKNFRASRRATTSSLPTSSQAWPSQPPSTFGSD